VSSAWCWSAIPSSASRFARHYREEMKEFAGELEFIDLSGHTLEEVKASVAALRTTASSHTPSSTAIDRVHSTIRPTPSGRFRRPPTADRGRLGSECRPWRHGRICSQRRRPRTGVRPSGRPRSCREAATKIPTAVKDLARPVFDDRELKRWRIADTLLPPASDIRFRARGVWICTGRRSSRSPPSSCCKARFSPGCSSSGTGRHSAEAEARRRLAEMAQMDRALTAGTMSASLAHELYQPLSAILSNAEAAEILLARSSPDLIQVKEILADIRRDDQRAADIIGQLRGLLKKSELAVEDVDVNALIRETVRILKPEATRRDIAVLVECEPDIGRCRANPIYLQQVILNLAINAMDAMKDSPRERWLTFQTASRNHSELVVSVADTGSGIPEGKLKEISSPWSPPSRRAPGSACRSPGRSSTRSAARSGRRTGAATAPCSISPCRGVRTFRVTAWPARHRSRAIPLHNECADLQLKSGRRTSALSSRTIGRRRTTNKLRRIQYSQTARPAGVERAGGLAINCRRPICGESSQC